MPLCYFSALQGHRIHRFPSPSTRRPLTLVRVEAEQFLSTMCNISPGYGAIFSGVVSPDLLPYQRSLFLLLRRLVIDEDAIVFMMDSFQRHPSTPGTVALNGLINAFQPYNLSYHTIVFPLAHAHP